MLFNVEIDRGDVIEGYLVPDGLSERPFIRVIGDAGRLAQLECLHARPAIAQAGRHETGLVGFRLDASIIPDIATLKRLEIHDAKTGLLVYRRPTVERPVPLKLFRLEFQMLPMVRFDHHCGRNFHYELPAIERYGHETGMQAFHLHAVKSIYLSGRVHLRTFEEFFDKGFQMIGYLPDPYYEMATRLAILKRLARSQVSFLADRDRMALMPAAEHFAEVPLDDERALKKALSRAGPKIRDVFVSPVTRQLVAISNEQSISRRDVAAAVDTLSRFAIVGQEGQPLQFAGAVGELLGLPADGIPMFGRNSILEATAALLRRIPLAETLLEEDLILDHYVREAGRTGNRRDRTDGKA